LFLKFTPKIPENPAGDFASIRFVKPALTGDPEPFPTTFDPWEDPKVGQPLEGFFNGGVNIKPSAPVPTLNSVSPARGPLAGGGKVLANGFGFLPAGGSEEDSRLFLVYRPFLGTPVEREAQVTSKSEYLLEFTAPAANLEPTPAVFADFDLEFRSPRGNSVLQNAYRYDALRITGTDRSSGSPSGSEPMTIYGYGIGPATGAEGDTRVEFRI